jgi:hypothetical protein
MPVFVHPCILPYPANESQIFTGNSKVLYRYGKIIIRMKTDMNSLSERPPRLFATLVKGFNLVASKVYLILIPVAVDLALWLGPKLRVRDLFLPYLNAFTTNMLKISPKELVETVKASNTLWNTLLEQFNLFTAIRTLPIGVPSLIARESPVTTPFGNTWLLETPSLRIGIAILGILLMVGFFLGTVYFNALSRCSNPEPEKFEWKRLFTQYGQTLLLFVIMIAVMIMIAIPVFILISIFTLVNAAIGQFFLMVLIFLGLWILVPLVFSPHGIFALDQKAFPSMLISMRMVRFFLPGTGMFVVVCALISEGLNLLWTVPPATSWLTLLGIGGHAFIVTALIAASFLYFREGLGWMKFNIQKMAEAKSKYENGGNPVEQ